MNPKTLAIIGIVISVIGALNEIRQLLTGLVTWWNNLLPLAQWIIIGLILYWAAIRKEK